MTELERTIVIVGAGFSGTAAAVNLLRLGVAQPLRIVLIDRAQIARGMAYASREYPYLLNVPAGRMALSSEDPAGFLEFARHRVPGATADDFLPRELYGEYLEATLRASELAAPAHLRLVRMHGHAVRIERTAGGTPLRVYLQDGRCVHGDDVVLALGNPPPARVPGAEALLEPGTASGRPRYVDDPWAAPLAWGSCETVLAVGTGLTMADIAVSAAQADDPIVVHALSRRGLLAPSQTAFRCVPGTQADDPGPALVGAAARSARQLMHLVRELCDQAERDGGDWREAITLVRHLAPELWGRMPLAERRRFLRHARSYWDIHRHRLPDETLETLNRLRRTHRLHVHAGRIAGFESHGEQVRVSWRPRGQSQAQTLLVDRVINCTGPDYDARRSRDPLVRALLADGLAVADPLGLGLATGQQGALVDRRGHAAPDLYYLGPMLRASSWEATAVPELRQHAERLARHLAARTQVSTRTFAPITRGEPSVRAEAQGGGRPRTRRRESNEGDVQSTKPLARGARTAQ